MISEMEGLGYYLAIHLFISLIFILAHSRTPKAVGQENSSYFHYSRLSIFLLFIGYIAYITFSVSRKIELGCGGVDAYSYKSIFESAVGQSFSDFNSSRREEFLYNLITWIISRFTSDFRYVLFIMHSVSYICFAISYRCLVFKNNKIMNFLYTFVILGWLFTMFNTMRFGVALSISLLVYVDVTNEKYNLAIVKLIVACLFHTSSIILLPPLLLCKIFKNQKDDKSVFTIILVALGMIIEVVLMPLISQWLMNSSYSSYDATSGIAIGTFIVVFISIILVLTNNRSNSVLLNDNFVFLACALLCIPIQMKYSIAYRMVILFMPIIYKNFVDLVYITNKSVLIGKGIKAKMVFIIALSYFLYRAYTLYTVDFVGDGLYPYKL